MSPVGWNSKFHQGEVVRENYRKFWDWGCMLKITQGITKTETKPKWSPRQSNKEFCPISLKVLHGKFLECEIYIYRKVL